MLAQMILIIVQVDLGAGRHRGALTPEDNVKGLHINFVTQPLCLIGLALVKISIGLLLLRLTTSKKFIRFIWGAIILTILSFTANFLVVMLQCRPLSFTWGGTTDGKCIASAGECMYPLGYLGLDGLFQHAIRKCLRLTA